MAGSVGVLSLFGVFVKTLDREVAVECQGTATAEFNEVLDAVPSDQVLFVQICALLYANHSSLT